MNKQLLLMYKLAVWDNNGRMYMPLFGYDNQVEAYAPARSALNIFFDNYGVAVQ